MADEDGPARIKWRGKYIGNVESRHGAHPAGMKFRPPSTLENAADNFGHWAVFWEVEDLRELGEDEVLSVKDIQSRAGKYYKPTFVPEGPTIVQTPW